MAQRIAADVGAGGAQQLLHRHGVAAARGGKQLGECGCGHGFSPPQRIAPPAACETGATPAWAAAQWPPRRAGCVPLPTHSVRAGATARSDSGGVVSCYSAVLGPRM